MPTLAATVYNKYDDSIYFRLNNFLPCVYTCKPLQKPASSGETGKAGSPKRSAQASVQILGVNLSAMALKACCHILDSCTN